MGQVWQATDTQLNRQVAVLTRELDLDRLPAETPSSVRRVVRRCLERNPKARLHDIGDDVADVRLAMEGAFETTGSATSESILAPMLPIWQRPMGVAVTVLVALAVGGIAAWSLTRSAPAPSGLITRFPLPLGANQRFTFPELPIAAISPDGTRVAYVANGSLWLRPLDELQAVEVSGTERGSGGPFFSADGQWIGFWADGQLKRVAVSGGAPVTIASVPGLPQGASWGDDDMVLYGDSDGIMQVPGASGTPALLIPADGVERFHGPQMLPDGEWMLFTVRAAGQTSTWSEAQIVVQSVKSRPASACSWSRGDGMGGISPRAISSTN